MFEFKKILWKETDIRLKKGNNNKFKTLKNWKMENKLTLKFYKIIHNKKKIKN